MTECCTSVKRERGWFHNPLCPLFPNIKQGNEGVGIGRREIAAHATRGRAHDWRSCDLPRCIECDYVEFWADRDDDEPREVG